MAVKNIIVNDYTVPAGVQNESVIEAAIKFNTNTISKYALKYIGTEKNCTREVVKRIASGVEGVTYTIRFSIKKAGATATVDYEFIAPDITIILSNQGYKVASSFNTDMEYINDAITKTFTA